METGNGAGPPIPYAKTGFCMLAVKEGAAETVSATGIVRGVFPALLELMTIDPW
jgi:hypothetical protein